MGKLQEARASAIQLDGKFHNMPGMEDGKTLDQMPIFINSPVLTLHTAQTNQGSFVAPCDLTIIGIAANVLEQPGTAAGTIDIGYNGDDDAYVAAYSFATDETLGYQALDLDDATVLSTSISQGAVVEFTTNGEATTTGEVALTLICIPA
jgi:hypothetical protein